MAITLYANNPATPYGVGGNINTNIETVSDGVAATFFPSTSATNSDNWFYAASTMPGVLDWPTGNYTWYVDVTTANSNVVLQQVIVRRDTSSLAFTPFASVSSGTLNTAVSSTGIMTGSVNVTSAINATGRASTDRLTMQIIWARSASAMNTQGFQYRVGLTTATRFDTPFTASSGTITATTTPITLTNKFITKI